MVVLLTQAVIPSIAADLIVEENGLSPNYASIHGALLAASPGDRIFVKNRPGGWTGAVNINKAVSVLPFDSNGTFDVSGPWTITALSAGAANFFPSTHRWVRIIGMNNIGGGIATTADNSTGSPVMVDVHGCQVTASIDLNHSGFEARITGNKINSGSIRVRTAHVIGNQLESGSIRVSANTGVSSLGDTLYIVGNRLASSGGLPGTGSIFCFGTQFYFHIANNWVHSSIPLILEIQQMRAGPNTNLVVNNSFRASFSNASDYMVLLFTDARILFSNNVLKGNGAPGNGIGVYVGFSLPLLEMTYNVFGDIGYFHAGGTTGGQVGNQQAAAGTLLPDNVTGVCTHALCVDGGNPAGDFTDLDGTRNDVGVAGGSFAPANFWPILTGSARVFLVKAPRSVAEGSTINVEASAVDR